MGAKAEELKDAAAEKFDDAKEAISAKFTELTGGDMGAKAEELKDAAAEKLADVQEAAAEKLEEAKEAASGLWGKVKGIFGA